MLFTSSLFALALAGVSQAIPAPSTSASTPAFSSSPVFVNSTKTFSSVLPAQSTVFAKNGTARATLTVSNFTDVAPTINAPAALQSITQLKNGTDIIPFDLSDCHTLIDRKAHKLSLRVGKPISGFITDDNWGTVHKNYVGGAIYCHDTTNGAHAVYGAVYRKWLEQDGNYGYPITDQIGTTDNAGTTVKYSVFSQSNAIYWTAQYGAFLIYGDIYQRWLSVGDVKSEVGFPITDETDSGNFGGRYNDFANGMIYWHAGTSWVHVGALPTRLKWEWNPIHLTDVTGSSTVILHDNGVAHWVSHLHDKIVFEFNWQIGWAFVNADGTVITLDQKGTVGPNWSGTPIFGGPTHDSDIDTTVHNSVISDNWRAWVAWNYGNGHASNNLGQGLIDEIVGIVKTVAPYVGAVEAVLQG